MHPVVIVPTILALAALSVFLLVRLVNASLRRRGLDPKRHGPVAIWRRSPAWKRLTLGVSWVGALSLAAYQWSGPLLGACVQSVADGVRHLSFDGPASGEFARIEASIRESRHAPGDAWTLSAEFPPHDTITIRPRRPGGDIAGVLYLDLPSLDFVSKSRAGHVDEGTDLTLDRFVGWVASCGLVTSSPEVHAELAEVYGFVTDPAAMQQFGRPRPQHFQGVSLHAEYDWHAPRWAQVTSTAVWLSVGVVGMWIIWRATCQGRPAQPSP
jgi:hypothetical protein